MQVACLGRGVSTKGNTSIAHPGSDCESLVRNEAGDLIARHQVPHNGGLPSIVADNKTTGAHVALRVDSNQLDFVDMAGESPIDGEGIMMTAYYGRSLGIEEDGGGGS